MWRNLAVLVLFACGGSDPAETDTTPTTTTPTTAATDCDDPTLNPFAGTCVETFLADCFDPIGECTYEQAGVNVTLTWANGATVVTEAGMTTTTTLNASDGTTCAVGTTEINQGDCFSRTTYQRQSGEQQVWCVYADGSFDVTCDDGTVIAVDAADAEGAQSCQYGEPCTAA